jgi:hypothetical protein
MCGVPSLIVIDKHGIELELVDYVPKNNPFDLSKAPPLPITACTYYGIEIPNPIQGYTYSLMWHICECKED